MNDLPAQNVDRIRVERRLELAAGHWELGEHPEAVVALERAAAEDPRSERIAALAEGWLQELDPGFEAELRERLHSLCIAARRDGDLPPVATSTMAELLAEQGHVDQAQRVAEEVLRRNPEDARALAVRERLQDTPAVPGGSTESAPTTPSAPPEWPSSEGQAEPVDAADVSARSASDSSRPDRIGELQRWLANLERRRFEGGYGTAAQRGGLR